MAIVLDDFDFEEGTENMGGMGGTINACPASDVDEIPAPGADGATVATDITCKTGKKFNEIYITKDTAELKSVEVGEMDGGSFENELEFFCPGNSAGLLKLKAAFSNGGFIFVCTDMQGQQRIVGSKQYPAYRVPGEITTGKDAKGRRGATFKFKASSPKPSFIYTGDVPLTPAA